MIRQQGAHRKGPTRFGLIIWPGVLSAGIILPAFPKRNYILLRRHDMCCFMAQGGEFSEIINKTQPWFLEYEMAIHTYSTYTQVNSHVRAWAIKL